MLRKLARQPTVVYMLVGALLVFNVAPGYAQTNPDVVRVAFLGVRFEDVKADVQAKLQTDLLWLMTAEKSLQVLSPEDVRDRIGEREVSALLQNLSKDSVLALSEKLEVDFIYAGELANQSRDQRRILLVGKFQRYDRSTRAVYEYEILKYYEDFSQELQMIKQQFVNTILPPPSSSFFAQNWPVLILGGIVLVGILAILLGPGKTTVEGNPPPEPIPN